MANPDRISIWSQIEPIVDEYVRLQRAELTTRWNNWNIDLKNREMFEVIGALLARQTSLVEELALAPNIWNLNIAPLVIRSMVDNYINLAWILADPVERARKFVLHGLGEEKLQIEHAVRRIIDDGGDPEENEVIKHRKEWLDSQRFAFLTEVNLGSWSGISTRKMAEEAGCLDVYNEEYQTHSSAAHNMWNFVGRFNLITCPNPLHGFHRIPLLYSQPDVYVFLEASELAQRTFRLFDEKTGVANPPPAAHEYLVSQLDEFGMTLKEMREQREQ